MDADRPGDDRQRLARKRAKLTRIIQEANALEHHGNIVHNRPGFVARDKRSVIAVTSVGKHFGPDLDTYPRRMCCDPAAGPGINDTPRPPTSGNFKKAVAELRVVLAGVIQGPVEFHVMKANTVPARDSFQGAHLLDEQQLQFVRRNSSGAAAKVASTPGPGMGANPHAVSFGETNAGFHRCDITGMTAAGHVGAGDGTHEGARAREGFAFAQITIQVELHKEGISHFSAG
jgi:hypothetical protein